MDQLARLVGGALGAVVAQHQHFGIRDRAADRIGPAIDLGRRQVGRAESLGQAVHQERRRSGQLAPQRVQRLARQPPAGVGEVAQRRGGLGRPVERRELDVERRHGGEAGDLLGGDRAQHIAWQQRVQQHDPSAGLESGRELAEAGVERQRQRRQQGVAGMVAEVARDAARARDEVAVREHDALRAAGAARGVEDGGDVGVDQAMPGARRRVEQRLPANDLQRWRQVRLGAGRRRRLGDDDMAQAGDALQNQRRQPLRRGDERAGAAVVQDVGHLRRLEQRIQRHEDGARGGAAETRDDGLEALFEVDRHPLAALHTERQQTGREGVDVGLEFGVAQRCGAVGQRARGRRAAGGQRRQIVKEGGCRHGRVQRNAEKCSAWAARARHPT